MKIKHLIINNYGQRRGFALAEAAIGIAIFSIMLSAMFAGLWQSLRVVEVSRENMRATQIMEEKMDTIRLYTWSQINATNFVPTTFQVPFDSSQTNIQTGALVFLGTVSIKPVTNFTESYKGQLCEVIVSLKWTSSKSQQQREMTTYVSQYGLQNYIY